MKLSHNKVSMKTHYNLANVKNIIQPIDNELLLIEAEIQKSGDPDSFGIIDHFEQMAGVGFAVCQTFLASVHRGKHKAASFKVGPFHSNGKSYALITNACANYWKHNDEWEKSNLSKQANMTIEVIRSLGIDIWSSYPLSQAIQTLSITDKKNFFSELLGKLNEWAGNI